MRTTLALMLIAMTIYATAVAIPGRIVSQEKRGGVEKVEPELKLGYYRCVGVTAEGQKYRGLAAIRKLGEHHAVHWYTGNGAVYGAGILRGDQFSVGWLSGPHRGVTIFTLKGDVLDGLYAQMPAAIEDPKVLEEKLTYFAPLDEGEDI